MNKNQKKLSLTAFVFAMIYFCYKTLSGITNLGEYTGWRFYALLAGTLIFGGMALTGFYFLPRIKNAHLKDQIEE